MNTCEKPIYFFKTFFKTYIKMSLFLMAVDTLYRYLKKQKELTEPFMMISNWKKPFDPHGLYKNTLALQWLTVTIHV